MEEIFDRMGLRTNVAKTVSIDFKPFRVLVGNSAEAYGLRMTGETHTYREHLHQRVRYPESKVELAAGSLASYSQAQNWVAQGNMNPPPPPTPG